MKKLPIAAAGLCVSLILPLSFAQSDNGSASGKGDAEAGKSVFEAQCLDCHNSDSNEAKTGPGLKGVKDGKLPSGMKATHDNILELVNEGRDEMPAFKEILTAKQKEDVVAYVLTL
jgi:mono/diheme cytochrome c family protein